MNDAELRCKALKNSVASRAGTDKAEHIVERAKVFYAFLVEAKATPAKKQEPKLKLQTTTGKKS